VPIDPEFLDPEKLPDASEAWDILVVPDPANTLQNLFRAVLKARVSYRVSAQVVAAKQVVKAISMPCGWSWRPGWFALPSSSQAPRPPTCGRKRCTRSRISPSRSGRGASPVLPVVLGGPGKGIGVRGAPVPPGDAARAGRDSDYACADQQENEDVLPGPLGCQKHFLSGTTVPRSRFRSPSQAIVV
jgi:hypothetical protein